MAEKGEGEGGYPTISPYFCQGKKKREEGQQCSVGKDGVKEQEGGGERTCH